MIVDSLITGVKKYFTTLDVKNFFGDEKVSLVLADKDGKMIASPKKKLSMPKNLDDVKALYEQITEEEKPVEEDMSVIELNATESITANLSKKTIEHPAETSRVYFDGARMNPTRMTIIAHVDKQKLPNLQTFVGLDKWMYVLHSKEMGGSISEIGFYENSKLYYIVSLNILDNGFKNTTKVQLEMREALLYDVNVSYQYGIKQTNNLTGNGKATKVTKQKEKVNSWYGRKTKRLKK